MAVRLWYRCIARGLFGVLAAQPLSAQARPDTARLVALDRALDSLRTRLRIPGLSAAVAYDDAVIWTRGYGFADVEGGVVDRRPSA